MILASQGVTDNGEEGVFLVEVPEETPNGALCSPKGFISEESEAVISLKEFSSLKLESRGGCVVVSDTPLYVGNAPLTVKTKDGTPVH